METDLRIPLTLEQKKLIAAAANANQADMAAWLRPIILRAARKVLDDKAVNKRSNPQSNKNLRALHT